MRFGVAVYPGSNCDYDTYYVIRDILKKKLNLLIIEKQIYLNTIAL
jgi:hypothetical protein